MTPLLLAFPSVLPAQLSPMWHDLLTMDMSVLEKVLRTVLVYAGIAAVIRIFGKRLMAQMNSLDLVVVLLLSNVVQNSIIGPDNSLVGGLLGALILVLANSGFDRLVHRFPVLQRFVFGRASTLVTDGVADPRALSRLGIAGPELDLALRHQGADSVSEVAHGELEPAGSIVIDLKPEHQNVSVGDLERAIDELRRHLDTRIDAISKT